MHALTCLLRWTLCLVLSAAGSRAVADGGRFALVIGNSEYGANHGLPNATSDARLMAGSLSRLGFAVTEHHNLGRDRLAASVAEFAARLPAGATAFVYYAGHGMQIGGSNFLTPVDLSPSGEASAKLRSYSLGTLLERLARAKSAVNVVVLDACRNNPFQPGAATRYRSFRDLGLARVDAPRGTLIAYSTSPGQLAADGVSSNSPYTAALAKALGQQDEELETIFRRVGNDVRRQTLDDQIPWYESSLAGAVFLHASSAVPGRANAAALRTNVVPARRDRRTRGLAAADIWYRQMNAAQWNQLDWEIAQRVSRLTPDELPALQHQASGGSVLAQTVIGLAYRSGIEPIQRRDGSTARYKANNRLAWEWLRKAADAGFPVAQAEIGEMYYQAHGVDRNLAESGRWLEQAARADYPRAKLDLLQLRTERSPAVLRDDDAVQSLMRALGAVPAQPALR
jgi:uncharacterized caspase-like protein